MKIFYRVKFKFSKFYEKPHQYSPYLELLIFPANADALTNAKQNKPDHNNLPHKQDTRMAW